MNKKNLFTLDQKVAKFYNYKTNRFSKAYSKEFPGKDFFYSLRRNETLHKGFRLFTGRNEKLVNMKRGCRYFREKATKRG